MPVDRVGVGLVSVENSSTQHSKEKNQTSGIFSNKNYQGVRDGTLVLKSGIVKLKLEK